MCLFLQITQARRQVYFFAGVCDPTRRGALGYSVLRFWLCFRIGFSVVVPKDFGFSVLVFIAVCGFFFFLTFGFRFS